MATFKSVVTKLGQARIAAAIESGKDISIIEMAVGDGGGKAVQPVATQTTLVNEVYRTKLNSLKIDAKNTTWVVAEAIISASVGGFWMREMGLYTDDGVLIAVCNMADTYKPTLAEGSGRTQTLRMVITVTDTSAVSLTIDDTLIIATEEYAKNLLAEHEKSRNHPDATLTDKGFTQLSSALDSVSETQAATPKAVKAVNDNANGRLPSDGTAVAASKLATARKIAGIAFDGTADISISASNVGALPASGTAVAASKLATARKIAGNAFDGTADISISASDVEALPAGGTAVAASKLATARRIAGNAFDGTTDISISASNVGALPAGGTAVAASKLATARRIAGVDFDGSKDINITAENVGAVQQGGGQSMGPNKVMLGWDGGRLIAQVDATPMGALYSERNKPTAQDTGAVSVKGGDVGYLNNADHYKIKPALWEGYGSLAGQYSNAAAPFFIPRGHRADATVDQFAPMIKAIVETAQYGFPAAISLGAYTPGDKRYPSAVIHIITDSGTSLVWQFDPNNGRLTCPGEIHSGGNIISASGVYEERGATRVYSPNYRPTAADVGAVGKDSCSYVGFVGGDVNQPYMRHESSSTVVQLMPRTPDYQQIGTYVVAWCNAGDIDPNQNVSGSNLYPSTADGLHVSWSLGGTWRCMGAMRTVNDAHRTTLWMRVY